MLAWRLAAGAGEVIRSVSHQSFDDDDDLAGDYSILPLLCSRGMEEELVESDQSPLGLLYR